MLSPERAKSLSLKILDGTDDRRTAANGQAGDEESYGAGRIVGFANNCAA